MSAKIHQFIRRFSTLAVVLLICFCTVTKPFFGLSAEAAYHQTYIQTTIDVSNWDILAGVVDIKTGFLGEPLEYSRVGGDTLSSLAGTSTPSAASSHLSDSPNGGGGSKEKNLVLTFPGNTKPEGGITHTDSTDKDSARAGLILNSLLFDMNAAFKFVYGSNYVPSGSSLDEKIENFRSDMSGFLSAVPSGSCNGASFSSGASGATSFVDSTVSADDYVTITKGGESRVFQYRMIKGYDSSHAGGLGLVTVSSGDATYIHWGHFAVEAFMNYTSEEKYQVTADDVYTSTPGALEKTFASMLDGLCNFIANSLGLWNFDQLIFNAGLRGTTSYAAGVFPASWQSYIWTFFFVAELAAIGVLLYAIIFNVGRRALSTVNPIARASAISQIESLFFVAIALGLLPVTIQLLMSVSFNLTGMFQDVLGTDITAVQRFSALTSGSGALGAVITRIIYLGAVIYFNFFYGIRALTIAILIITGPVFISCIGINEKKRMLAETWAREFAANLFIQPLQAMMMSFILLLPSTGRTFDAIVLAYAMIPLTHMVRGLFFGSAGSFAHQLADKGRGKTMQTLGRGATLAGGMALGAAGGAIGAGIGAFGSSRSNSVGENSNGGSNNSGANGALQPQASFTPPTAEGTAPATQTRKPIDASSKETQTTQQQGTPAPQLAAAPVQAMRQSSPSAAPKQQVTAGVDSSSTTNSNAVTAGIREGEGTNTSSDDKPADPDTQIKAGKGMGMAAAAIALGAAGGAVDHFNRRVFGVQSRGGGVITQLSRSAAASSNRALHPEASASPETPAVTESRSADENPVSTVRDDFNRIIPVENDYSGNQDTGNAYESGAASMVGTDNGIAYQIDKDGMRDAGIRINSDKGRGTASVSYDLSKLSTGDANRAREMAAIYAHGSEEERAQLEQAGIETIHLRTKMVNGQEMVTGVDMTINPETFKENFGIDVQPASMGGKGVEVSASSRSDAPQFVPDVTQHLNNSTMKSFTSSVQGMGGSVSQLENGQTQVSVPAAQLPQFQEKYPSVDTSATAITDDGMATFSVPSSSLLEGSSPQSPVVRQINQARHITSPPVSPTPAEQPDPALANSYPPPGPPASGPALVTGEPSAPPVTESVPASASSYVPPESVPPTPAPVPVAPPISPIKETPQAPAPAPQTVTSPVSPTPLVPDKDSTPTGPPAPALKPAAAPKSAQDSGQGKPNK